jgi:hypothetical protein
MGRSAIIARHNIPKERTIVDFERQDNDWYVEPTWCVRQLIAASNFRGTVHDPCCGGGTIPKAFHAAGFNTTACDIVERGYGDIHDFFKDDRSRENMVFNPPYKIAEQFIARAIDRIWANGLVAAIVNIKFLASQGRRDRLFKQHPPLEVLICSQRPSMPPGGGLVEAKGGTADYCWIVWRPNERGSTRLRWLDRS